jgi:hypothetical protein
MKKTTFVPSADCLESRIAMSGGIKFIGGLPVLTPRALSETYGDIGKAFKTFATKGENYKLLEFNLTKAVDRIPFNVRDGLVATVQSEPSALQSDIESGLPLPVIFETQNTNAEVTNFVQSEVEGGVFIYT